MFGYVTVCRDELKIKDYNLYRAYYCGLCRQLGKSYGQLTRLGLSYDLTFLAILLDSLNSSKSEYELGRCLKHIGAKRTFVKECNALTFAADISIILTYYKLCDDISDGKALKARIERLPFYFSAKRACIRLPYLAEKIRQRLKMLSELENSGANISVDEAAHPFALLMSDIFSGSDETERLGYNIGRFIYITDAVDDYDNDFSTGSFNPLVRQFGNRKDEMLRFAEESLVFTLSQAKAEYDKLVIYKNKAILDNIINLGLMQTLKYILSGRDKKTYGKSI